MRYYFLVTSLPSLALKSLPEISFHELYDQMRLNAPPRDLAKFKQLLEIRDLHNLRALWKGLSTDDKGTMTDKELEEAILVRDSLPPYIIEFLDRYDSPEERLRFFPSLYASLYRQEVDGFLRTYYAWEREVRLVLTALRAKKGKWDLAKELQFEDPQDPLVAEILAQKDLSEYTPPQEYEVLKELFMNARGEPRKLEEGLLKYRFQKIGEWESEGGFSLDRILAYAAQLLVVESSLQLDLENGKIELEKYG